MRSASMGRYIANTLERQQELGIKLDNTVILQGSPTVWARRPA